MMTESLIAPELAPLLGDPEPLLEQVRRDLPAPRPVLGPEGVHSLPQLQAFLASYRADVLVPLELPAIVAAHGCATRNEFRELLALDAALAADARLRSFVTASCRVGQRQLARLRPLRDQRVVQRYVQAVDEGRAGGWHTLVYGLALGVFSLPLRQGLVSYAAHTLQGFIEAAAPALRLTADELAAAQAAACDKLPAQVNALLLTPERPTLALL